MSKTKAGDAFAALYDVEFNELSNSSVEKAWDEVHQALKNLFGPAMAALRDEIRSAKHIAAQRTLQFNCMDHQAKCVPDLIAFFEDDRPPLIVDWKVHVFGTNDYGEQLLTYALAFARTKPHKDFPMPTREWTAPEIRLVEAQLLTARARWHEAVAEDFAELEVTIGSSINTMLLAVDGQKSADLRAEDFPAAANPGTCVACPFKNICCENLP